MIHWFNKYRDKVGTEHVQERPHVQLSTSHTHTHKYPCMCMVYSLEASQSDCTRNLITTTLTGPSQNRTTCRDICVGVTCGQFDMRSFLNMFHLYLVPILFKPVSHPYISF